MRTCICRSTHRIRHWQLGRTAYISLSNMQRLVDESPFLATIDSKWVMRDFRRSEMAILLQLRYFKLLTNKLISRSTSASLDR